jgi:hypothetical protein
MIVLFMSIMFVSNLLQPASAFKLVEHATCKDIGVPMPTDPSTAMLLMNGTLVPTCRQRTPEFLLTDEVAWFFVKGTFEPSDVGLKVLFKFYDPHGQVFAVGPAEDQNRPISDVGNMLLAMPLLISSTRMETWILLLGEGESAVYLHSQEEPASSRPGEWLAEFTLGGRVVASERFRISETITTAPTPTTVTTSIVTGTQTQPSAAAMPFAIVLPATVIVVVASVGLTLLVRRRRARTKISPSPSTSG